MACFLDKKGSIISTHKKKVSEHKKKLEKNAMIIDNPVKILFIFEF